MARFKTKTVALGGLGDIWVEIVTDPLVFAPDLPLTAAISQLQQQGAVNVQSLPPQQQQQQRIRAHCGVVRGPQGWGLLSRDRIVDVLATGATLNDLTVANAMVPITPVGEQDLTLATLEPYLNPALDSPPYCPVVAADQSVVGLLRLEALQTCLNCALPHQTEQVLNSLETRFATLTAAVPVGIFRTDPEGRCLYVNPCWCDMAGLTLAQARGDGWAAALHPDDRPQVFAAWQQAVATHTPFELEYRLQRPDSETVWVLGKALAERDLEGTIVGYVGTVTDLSVRHRLQTVQQEADAIQAEAHLLESVLDIVLAGYWDWDIPAGEEYLSTGFKRMFGYEDAELANRPETWQRLIFPEDLPGVLAGFKRHVTSRGQVPFHHEVRYRHKDGSTVWVICSGKVIQWDTQGNPLRMVGCHIDITQRKRAEAELQATKEELERFFTLDLDLLCIADLQGHFRRVNRAWERILGYGVAELEGQRFLDFVHPDDVTDTLTTMAQLADQSEVLAFVNRYRCRDGSYRHIEWYSRPYGDLIYAAARDVTDRLQAEMQTRKSDTHLKVAQRIGRLGSWEFDVATEDIFWSEEVYRIFGLDPALGPPSYEELIALYHPEDQIIHREKVATAIQTAQPYDLELRARRPNGESVYVQARGEPIVDADGHLVQLIGTVLDITERKRTEVQLRRTTAQLQASNQELEAFAYSVSHDLRAPLRAINGFSQAILEDYGDQFQGDARDYFDRILHNVNRMGALIDDLLRLSRVSRSPMNYGVVNLSHLVQEQVAQLQATEPERQVTVVVAPTAIVTADSGLMGVVINNLVQNAWKFTSKRPDAQIEFGQTNSDHQPVYFVKDNGAGFDMAYADKLFGVFQRLHNTHEFPGTGIGLATVQRAIHRHGGRIWAEAAVEEGATFHFTIPDASSGNVSQKS
ncbi:MAG: PAS domain-containing protein [Cyanobacteria bacterium]|nr:PAS domain-containing protein [Cyanobacteriota bacterium]